LGESPFNTFTGTPVELTEAWKNRFFMDFLFMLGRFGSGRTVGCEGNSCWVTSYAADRDMFARKPRK
jgi:hypothetical protein